MADKFGINQEIIVVPELTYGVQGTAFSASMTKHQNLSLNWEAGVQPINTLIRNSSLVKSVCEDKAGRKMPTVTVSGDLTKENATWLLAGTVLNSTATGTYTVGSQGSYYSYQFLQYDTTTDTANIFTGCTMETLTLTREADKITFTANYRAKDIARNVDLSAWTGDEPVAVCEEQALFLNTAWTSSTFPTSVTGFTLTLTNNFVDDDTIFLTSATKSKEVAIGTTGSLELSYIASTDDDYTNDILDETDGIGAMSITTTFNTGSLSLTFSGKILNATEPDPERNRFIGNLSLDMIKSDTLAGFTGTLS